jgi:hypothetical protein
MMLDRDQWPALVNSETLDSIKGRELFDYMRNYQLLKKDSVPRSRFIIIIIIYLLQLGLHPVAVVLTLHNYNKKHTITTTKKRMTERP